MHIPWGAAGVGSGLSIGILSRVSSTIFMSLRLAPSTAKPIGIPLASTNWLRLTPRLARSVGFFPVFFPPERRLGHVAVHARPGPVDPFHLVVAQQTCLPHLFEDPGFDPFLEAIVRRGTRAKLRGVQCFPLTAGAQYEEDRIHAYALRCSVPTATEPMSVLMYGQKVLKGLPKIIRNAPVLRNNVSFHGRGSPYLRSCPENKCSCTKQL